MRLEEVPELLLKLEMSGKILKTLKYELVLDMLNLE